MNCLRTSQHKARKEHKCSYCNLPIRIGETYNYSPHTYYGDFYIWKSHISCNDLVSKLKMHEHCGEGVTSDDFWEYVQEEFKPNCESDCDLNWEQRLKRVKEEHQIL